VQLTPLARLVGWAQFTRQSTTALRLLDNPQPPHVSGEPRFSALGGTAVRTLPTSNSYLRPSRFIRLPAAQLTAVRWAAHHGPFSFN